MSIKHLTDENFAAEVASGVTLVDFWADWCGPCRMLAPVIEELAAESTSGATFAKLDTDENADTAIKHGITAIPTVIVFRDGREVSRIMGVQPKSVYVEALA